MKVLVLFRLSSPLGQHDQYLKRRDDLLSAIRSQGDILDDRMTSTILVETKATKEELASYLAAKTPLSFGHFIEVHAADPTPARRSGPLPSNMLGLGGYLGGLKD